VQYLTLTWTSVSPVLSTIASVRVISAESLNVVWYRGYTTEQVILCWLISGKLLMYWMFFYRLLLVHPDELIVILAWLKRWLRFPTEFRSSISNSTVQWKMRLWLKKWPTVPSRRETWSISKVDRSLIPRSRSSPLLPVNWSCKMELLDTGPPSPVFLLTWFLHARFWIRSTKRNLIPQDPQSIAYYLYQSKFWVRNKVTSKFTWRVYLCGRLVPRICRS